MKTTFTKEQKEVGKNISKHHELMNKYLDQGMGLQEASKKAFDELFN